jgi:hypothetical protein
MRKTTVTEGLTLVFLYTIVSSIVLFVFLVRPGLTGHPQADFPQLMDGTAHKPYVARALLPIAVRVLSSATPSAFKNGVADQVRGRRMIDMLDWQDPYLYEYILASLLMLMCLVGFAFVLRGLTAHYYQFPNSLTNLAPLIGLSLLPLFFRYYSYLYDPGNLLFFSLSVLLLVQGRFGLFVLSFLAATLNKETSILLVLLFVWQERSSPTRVTVYKTALLLVVWISGRGLLEMAYRDNPGGMLEHHFWEHTIWLLTKFPIAMRYFLLVAAVFFVFIRHNWRAKPGFLKAGLFITLVPLLVSGLFFGFADELRGYYETFPFLFLLSIPSIYRFIRA